MSQYLPTGNFKWMTDKEISKIDLGKYKADGKNGFILEVDLEYPQELHDMHNDYPVCPEKQYAISLLQEDCQKIQHLNWLSKQTYSNIKRQERVCVALS